MKCGKGDWPLFPIFAIFAVSDTKGCSAGYMVSVRDRLNRQQLAMLFDRDVKTIGKHINNALKEELSDVATIAKFATVQVTRTVQGRKLRP